MKDRKKRERELGLPRTTRFWSFLALLLFCALCSTCVFDTFRFIGVTFRPVLLTSGRNPSISAVAAEYNSTHEHATRRRIFRQSPARLFDAVLFPDQILVFVNDPAGDSPPLDSPQCLFYGPDSPNPDLALPLISIDAGRSPLLQIARCPLPPRRLSRVSLREDLPPSPISRTWRSLAYKAVVDAADNTTVVFVKGVSLRPEKVAEASRFECVYGWNFTRGRFLRAAALSVAQEIVRCPTPLVLINQPRLLSSVKVSVNVKGRGIFPSVARPESLLDVAGGGGRGKPYRLCVCTMVRNQAKFLHEWVAYHARVGVGRWFIYDNNSDDGLEGAARVLGGLGHNVSVHEWPWIKTQEAGFAHCALRARDACDWVGFIDVDEFLHLPSNQTVLEVVSNHSHPWVGELRTSCLSFGPSGLKQAPPQGVTVGYTCRMAAPERHKSIVRPEALNSSLVNVVHHFHLREGYEYVNVERGAMVINHYKYQVWDVFKEKFYRRVATYVADWQENENEGSKDRAPGLGTRAVEPTDWSSRFCEVTDNGLRNWVLQEFMDPHTRLLPWQQQQHRHHHHHQDHQLLQASR